MSETETPVQGAPNYATIKVIGSGQFGDVYKARKLDTNEFIAFKSIQLDLFDNVARLHEMADNETQILAKINNPNVVKFIEIIKTNTHIYTVYELCTGGTLEELLDQKRYLPEKDALQIFRQVLNGFRPLVQFNIMHRDIKPSNIIFHNNIAKIGDFGFSKPLTSSFEVTETMVGSPIYMAPEILKGQSYSIKADIYSMGVMLYEVLFGRAPYEDVNIPGLLNKISKGDLRFLSYNKISPSTEHLIRKLLDPVEETRISWQELFDIFRLTQTNETDIYGLQEEFTLEVAHNEPQVVGILESLHMDSSKIEAKEIEIILAYFTKDCKKNRDKLLFLWRTFSQGYDHIINDESHIINLLTLHRIKNYSKEVEKVLQNQQGQMTKKEFVALSSQFDYARISAILTNEVTKFNDAIGTYKTYMQTIVDPTKPPRIDQDPVFLAIEADAKTFNKRVHAYATSLKESIKSGSVENQSTNGNLPLYLNLLLDCIMIDEMYDNFFELEIAFNEQPYLQNLFDMNESELLELADEKLIFTSTSKGVAK